MNNESIMKYLLSPHKSKIIKLILLLVSMVYFLIIKLKEFLYKTKILQQKRLPCKVISLGNITTGGTGKTPLTKFIAESLQDKKVGILIRGYKRKSNDKIIVVRDNLTPAYVGDEPYFLAKELPLVPVFVCLDRYAGGKFALDRFKTEILILDDGFQRRLSLYRDIDIVVIDATNPFGNGYLIPRGILRERIENLKEADIFFLTKVDGVENIKDLIKQLKEINDKVLIVESVYEPVELHDLFNWDEKYNINELKDKKILALSGIGNPSYFEKIVFKLGTKEVHPLRFLDHHNYTKEDVVFINKEASRFDYVITTQKDSVKLSDSASDSLIKKILVLKIKIKIIKGEKEFFEIINCHEKNK
ncbi:MAG: tetraacyldisaccharide 4'-kinase [Candidatus Firestonebacteria bacterium]